MDTIRNSLMINDTQSYSNLPNFNPSITPKKNYETKPLYSNNYSSNYQSNYQSNYVSNQMNQPNYQDTDVYLIY